MTNSAGSIYCCEAAFEAPILATVRFRHAEYDVAVAFARPAERPKPVDDRAIEPDPHLSVRADGPRRAVRQRRLYGVVRGRGDCDRDHRPKRVNGPLFLSHAAAVAICERNGNKTVPACSATETALPVRPNAAMSDRWAPNFGRTGRPACDHAGRPLVRSSRSLVPACVREQ